MINWWAIHYDPERFPEPHLFKPDRFVHFPLSAAEEANHADPYQRSNFGFGGGRRICPGMHVAERSMFINIARTLWGFNINFKRDSDGKIIPVDFSLKGTEDGSNCTPKPFACGLCPVKLVDNRYHATQ
jgi:Cytochrome P450